MRIKTGRKFAKVAKLTPKKPGGIGPPGMPSFGGICPSGDGAGPAFCEYRIFFLFLAILLVKQRLGMREKYNTRLLR